MARPVDPPPREVPWAEWWEQFRIDYRATRDNAQHVSILGPTGTGKSTLALKVAELRPYVAVLAAKPRDTHMKAMLRAGGYRKVDRLPEAGAGLRRVFLWPRNVGTESHALQRATFDAAMSHAYRVGVWHLVVDEGHFLADTLRLGDRIRGAYQMGRSNGHGIILAAQRPAWLPRDIYSSADHLLIFGTNDSADLKSISGLNGVNDRTVRDCVATLTRAGHRFVHVNTRTGQLAITALPKGHL